MPDPLSLSPGQTIAGVEVVEVIATTGDLVVARAKTGDGGAVLLVATPELAEQPAWTALRACEHDNLLRGSTRVSADGAPGLLFPLPARSRALSVGPPTTGGWRQGLQVAWQIVAALGALHDARIAHGAIGPAMVYLDVKDQALLLPRLASLEAAKNPPAAMAKDLVDAARLLAWLIEGGTCEGAPDLPERAIPGSLVHLLHRAKRGEIASAAELLEALSKQVASVSEFIQSGGAGRSPLFSIAQFERVLEPGVDALPDDAREIVRARLERSRQPASDEKADAVVARLAPATGELSFTSYVITPTAPAASSYDPDVAAYTHALSIDRFEQLRPLFSLLPGGQLIYWIILALKRSGR